MATRKNVRAGRLEIQIAAPLDALDRSFREGEKRALRAGRGIGHAVRRGMQHGIDDGGRGVATKWLDGIERKYESKMAAIREAQARGFITEREAALRGQKAADAFNQSLLRGLDRLRRTDKISDDVGREMVGRLKAEGFRAGRALTQGLEKGTRDGDRVAERLAQRLRSKFERAETSAQLLKFRGKIDDAQFERLGRKAAGDFNRALAAGIEKLRLQGRISDRMAAQLTAELKETGFRGGKALGDGIEQGARGSLRGGFTWVKGIGALIAADLTTRAVMGTKQLFTDAIRAAEERGKSFLRLASAARLFGVEEKALIELAQQARTEYQLGATDANNLAVQVTKLAAKAGMAAESQTLLARALDLGAAQGYDANEVATALEQTLRGMDEGTDRLLQKNPSQIYAEYAATIGKAAGALDDVKQKQALVNAILEKGGVVAGAYGRFLEDDIGKLSRFRRVTEEATASLGAKLLPVIVRITQQLEGPLTAAVEFLGALLSVLDEGWGDVAESTDEAGGTLAEMTEGLHAATRAIDENRETIQLWARLTIATIGAVVQTVGGFFRVLFNLGQAIGRAIETVVYSAAVAADKLVIGALKSVNWLLDQIDRVPGVDIAFRADTSEIEKEVELLQMAARDAAGDVGTHFRDIHDTVENVAGAYGRLAKAATEAGRAQEKAGERGPDAPPLPPEEATQPAAKVDAKTRNARERLREIEAEMALLERFRDAAGRRFRLLDDVPSQLREAIAAVLDADREIAALEETIKAAGNAASTELVARLERLKEIRADRLQDADRIAADPANLVPDDAREAKERIEGLGVGFELLAERGVRSLRTLPPAAKEAVEGTRRAIAALGAEDPTIELTADPSPLAAATEHARERLRTLDAERVRAELGADAEPLLAAISRANGALEGLDGRSGTISFAADIQPAEAEIARLAAMLADPALREKLIRLGIDLPALEQHLDTATAAIGSVEGASVTLDISQARAAIEELRSAAAKAAEIGIDPAPAEAAITAIETRIEEAEKNGALSISLADFGAALQQAAEWEEALNRAAAATAKVPQQFVEAAGRASELSEKIRSVEADLRAMEDAGVEVPQGFRDLLTNLQAQRSEAAAAAEALVPIRDILSEMPEVTGDLFSGLDPAEIDAVTDAVRSLHTEMEVVTAAQAELSAAQLSADPRRIARATRELERAQQAARDKTKGFEAALRAAGLEGDQLRKVLDAISEALNRQGIDLDRAASKWDRFAAAAAGVGGAIDAIRELGEEAGVLDEGMSRKLAGASQLAGGVSGIAQAAPRLIANPADLTAWIQGIQGLSQTIGGLSGIFGGSDEEARRNREAMGRLQKALESLETTILNDRSTQELEQDQRRVGRAADVLDDIKHTDSSQGYKRRRALAYAAERLGLADADDKEGAIEALRDYVAELDERYGTNLAEFVENSDPKGLMDALRLLEEQLGTEIGELGTWGDDVAGIIEGITWQFRALGKEDPVERMRAIVEALKAAGHHAGDFQNALEELAGLDLSTDEGRRRRDELIAQMVQQMAAGGADFGDFTPEELRELIEEWAKAQPGDAPGGETNSYQVNRSVSEVTAGRLVGYLATIAYWAERIARMVAAGVEKATGQRFDLAPPPAELPRAQAEGEPSTPAEPTTSEPAAEAPPAPAMAEPTDREPWEPADPKVRERTGEEPQQRSRPVETEAPEPVRVEGVAPEAVQIDAEAPAPVRVDTETPDPVAVKTIDPDPVAVRTEAPAPVQVEAEAPAAVRVPVEAPRPAPIEVEKPEPIRVEAVAPEHVEAAVIAPEPVEVNVRAPEPLKPPIAPPAPISAALEPRKRAPDPVATAELGEIARALAAELPAPRIDWAPLLDGLRRTLSPAPHAATMERLLPELFRRFSATEPGRLDLPTFRPPPREQLGLGAPGGTPTTITFEPGAITVPVTSVPADGAPPRETGREIGRGIVEAVDQGLYARGVDKTRRAGLPTRR